MTWMNKNFDPRKHERFFPKNPDKYHGKDCPIARSSWETTFMKWCDNNPDVIRWSSESIEIPYRDPIQPVDKFGKPKTRRYYPDFLVQIRDKVWLVEIKPFKETQPPKTSTKKSKNTLLTEERTWRINKAKWEAADKICRLKGWQFRILTEKELFGKK